MARRRSTLGTGHVTGQHALPGFEYDRLLSRDPKRDGDPLTHPDGCKSCGGTGVDTSRPEPAGTCGHCGGSGWRS
jgi:DnaJ-class molecular chaperone